MIRTAALFLAPAAFARATTTFGVSLVEGDTLFNGLQFAPGVEYTVVFQLIGGTTSNSTAILSSIDLGGGTVSTSFDQYRATAGPGGLAEGSLALSVAPDDAFAYFLQQYTSGTQFGFTVALSGLYSPPTPDAFTFQLYDQSSNIVYEQTFNVTSPVPVPECTNWLAMLSGLGFVCGLRRAGFRSRTR